MKSNIIKRYLTFAASLAVSATGIALVTRANLGTIPSLCPPYVLSCIPGQELTLGILTIMMHVVFLAIQAILLRSDFAKRDLIQIPAAIVLGILIDLAMIATQTLQWGDNAAGYLFRAIQLAIGIALIIAARTLQLSCHEKMAGEGLVQAFAKTLKTKPLMVAIVFDISLATTGLIFCIFYFGSVRWEFIGIGTLLSLLARAAFVLRLMRDNINLWDTKADQSGNMSSPDGAAFARGTFPLVVTIARMHGSGGRDIGYMVAQRLGINFYDKEIIAETAKQLGIEKEQVQQWDQDTSIRSLGRDGAVFAAQSLIIRNAAKESCVIIGRCADYVLRGRPYCLNIFIRSDEDYAVTLIRNKDNLSEEQAREVIRLKNNARERHYAHYTGGKWQDPAHYDLVINTAKIGVESAVDIICNAVNNITGA
jgi:uncharacterized membrane protein YczE/cytidylate kinase